MTTKRTGVLVGAWLALAACHSTSPAGGAKSSSSGSSATGASTGVGSSGASRASSGTSSGSASSGAGSSGTSGTSCGLNQQLCSGGCVVTLTDPSHCGGCQTPCLAQQVCVSGACIDGSACPEGTTDCDGACVDTQSSNTNCGGCNAPCGADRGCASGTCVAAVPLTGSVSCPGGGAPVLIADGGANACTGHLAQVTFRYGLCTCADATFNNALTTDAFNSAQGGYVDGGLGAAIGVDGELTLNGSMNVSGACWIGGTDGLTVNNASTIGLDLHVNGGTLANNPLMVGGDALVNGNVTTNAAVTIGGTLYLPASATLGSNVTDQAVVRGPVSIPPPCDCSPSQLIDVAGIVASGNTSNDNAAIGLSADALAATDQPTRLDLPCGRYYLSSITPNAAVTVVVHGRTALFVGGDVQPNATMEITLDPSATLDLFVDGNMILNEQSQFGSTLVPAQSRIYIAGANVTLNSGLLLAGNFYLPNATLIPNGALELYGSIFAGSLQDNNTTHIHYDSAILSAGQECGDGGAGTSEGGCTSCSDCGNQACVAGTCGKCTTDADCCSPLQCRSGTCELVFR